MEWSQESLSELEVGSCGPTHPVKVEKVKFLTREIQVTLVPPPSSQAAIRKTKAWNTGQLEGLDRHQTTLEEEVEAIERSLHKVPGLQCSLTHVLQGAGGAGGCGGGGSKGGRGSQGGGGGGGAAGGGV